MQSKTTKNIFFHNFLLSSEIIMEELIVAYIAQNT